MNHTNLFLLSTFALSSSIFAANYVEDGDFDLVVSNGRVVTNAHAHATDEEFEKVRAFGYAFGDDPEDPYSLFDPGFGAELGSGLPQGAQLNFNALHRLRYWDGNGRLRFTDAPGGEFIRFNRAATDVDVSATSAAQNGFAIANIGAGGAFHAHLNTFLMNTDSLIAPAVGMYLTILDVGVSSGGVGRSLPAYVLFNNGASSEAFTAALEYLADPLAGDASLDGKVDTADFNLLAGGFGQSGKFFFDGDLNESGAIDSVDFSILAGSFGQSSSPPLTASVVPEPTSIAGLVLLGLMGIRRR